MDVVLKAWHLCPLRQAWWPRKCPIVPTLMLSSPGLLIFSFLLKRVCMNVCMSFCMCVCMYYYYFEEGCVCSVMNVHVWVQPTLLGPHLPTCMVWNSSSGIRGRKHLTCWELLLTHEFISFEVSTPQESNSFSHKIHFHFRTRYFLLWECRISIDRLPELIPR